MKIKYLLLMTSLFATMQSQAGDVKMFSDRVPTAEEMANILFSSTDNDSKPIKAKARSVSFTKKASEPKAPTVKVANNTNASSSKKMGAPLKFAYNSTEILPESRVFLDQLGKMLSRPDLSNKKMVIEGHTDAAGSDFYNQYLSEQRAGSVRDYLVTNFQISSNRLLLKGKGETEPLPELDPEDEGQRRVQFYEAH